MFYTPMTEFIQNVVEIEDFDEKTVKDMLESIYTGETKTAEESYMDLREIMDHYEVISSVPVKYQIRISRFLQLFTI